MIKILIVVFIIFMYCCIKYSANESVLWLKKKYDLSEESGKKASKILSRVYTTTLIVWGICGFMLGVLAYKNQWLG